jgi:S-adenosylmethionine synthetase
MTMESVAGKNPVTHVGKLYNALAGLVAQDLVDGIPGVAEATCHLVSQIGRSIADPQLADVRLRCDDLDDAARARVEEIVHQRLGQISTLWKDIATGALALDRWPLAAAHLRIGAVMFL